LNVSTRPRASARALVVSASLLVPLLAVPARASADEVDDGASSAGHVEGVALGVRTGYGIPLGSTAGRTSSSASGAGAQAATTNTSSAPALSDTISGQVPIWLDLGYRVNAHLYLGLFGSYGFGLAPTDLCKGITCSVSDIRFGLNAHWHFLPDGTFDPWVGLGIGYEILGLSAEQTQAGQTATAHTRIAGLEVANLQVGADYKVSPAFGIGPMLTASLAQYSDLSVEVKGPGFDRSSSGTFSDKTWHSWLFFGVRGELDVAVGEQPPPSRDSGFPPPRGASGPARTAAEPVRAPSASAPPPALLDGSGNPINEAPAPSLSPSPPPQAPGAWPTSVGVADRTQCTYRCMSNGGAVNSAALERHVSRQLGAIRQCAQQTGEPGRIPSEASFSPGGALTFSVDIRAARSTTMQECVSRIPTPGAFNGPPNQHWKCWDYCP